VDSRKQTRAVGWACRWLLLFALVGADAQAAWRGKEGAWRALWPGRWPRAPPAGLRTIALPRSRARAGQAAPEAAWIMNPGMLADET
jgi:hypothetical protein